MSSVGSHTLGKGAITVEKFASISDQHFFNSLPEWTIQRT